MPDSTFVRWADRRPLPNPPNPTLGLLAMAGLVDLSLPCGRCLIDRNHPLEAAIRRHGGYRRLGDLREAAKCPECGSDSVNLERHTPTWHIEASGERKGPRFRLLHATRT